MAQQGEVQSSFLFVLVQELLVYDHIRFGGDKLPNGDSTQLFTVFN